MYEEITNSYVTIHIATSTTISRQDVEKDIHVDRKLTVYISNNFYCHNGSAIYLECNTWFVVYMASN